MCTAFAHVWMSRFGASRWHNGIGSALASLPRHATDLKALAREVGTSQIKLLRALAWAKRDEYRCLENRYLRTLSSRRISARRVRGKRR